MILYGKIIYIARTAQEQHNRLYFQMMSFGNIRKWGSATMFEKYACLLFWIIAEAPNMIISELWYSTFYINAIEIVPNWTVWRANNKITPIEIHAIFISFKIHMLLFRAITRKFEHSVSSGDVISIFGPKSQWQIRRTRNAEKSRKIEREIETATHNEQMVWSGPNRLRHMREYWVYNIIREAGMWKTACTQHH